jgi:hypothetical protein
MLRLILLATNYAEGNYQEPDWFQPLMQFNDRFGVIIWPALGLAVVGFIAWGTINTLTHRSIPPEEKVRCKKEIVTELRRQLNGMSIEQVARLIKHDSKLTHTLLVEMTRDGMLKEVLNTKGATIYRLKGVRDD